MRLPAAEDGAPLRPPIAVLLSRFPRVTETFILREVEELERQGQPVVLVPLIRERPAVVHAEARPWLERALFTPWLSPAIAAANLRTLRRRPGAYLGCLARLAAGMTASPGFLARSLVLFPKAVFLAERLAGGGGSFPVAHVHAHFATHPATVAWVIERLAGVPYSVTVHAHDLFVRRTMLGEKLRRARFVRAISRFNREYLAERYPEAAGKLEVVHVGVDDRRYFRSPSPAQAFVPQPKRRVGAELASARDSMTTPAPGGDKLLPYTLCCAGVPTPEESSRPAMNPPPGTEEPRRAAGLEKRLAAPELRVLTVAALQPYKGLEVLLAAAGRLRKRLENDGRGARLSWEVIGEGPLRRRLERQIARRGLGCTVRLAGALPQDEVARRLAGADLVALTSVVAPDGQMEGIPVVLMEALAAGKPVVASDLSGIPELVEDGVTGLLAPPGDPEAVAAALERLAREPELAARLGAAGRERVAREFRLETTVAELLARIDRETGSWTRGARTPGGTAGGAAGPAPGAGEVPTGALDPELERAIRALLEAAGLDGRPAGLRALRESPDSRVAELLVAGPDGPREVVVKLHRSRPEESAPPAERARREHDLLERLETAGRGGPFGVPRPLAFTGAGGGAGGGGADGPGAALAMARARGEPLERRIRALRLRPGRRARSALAADFRRAGQWLRWFQGEMGEDRRHGDLWPGNVFVAEDRLEVIDLEGVGPGGRWDDAAYFLLHAELYFALPGAARQFPRLERAFVEGLLGRSPGATEEAALTAVRSRTAAELLAGSRAEGRPPLRAWHRRLLRGRLTARRREPPAGRAAEEP